MKKDISTAMQEYKSSDAKFISRVVKSSFKPIVLAALLIIVFLGISYRDKGGEFALIIGFCLLLYVIITSWFQNIIHLKTVILDNRNRIVYFEIYRFNKILRKAEYEFDKVRIDIRKVMFIYESYFLIIDDPVKKKRIIKQPLVGGWELNQFKEIVTVISSA